MPDPPRPADASRASFELDLATLALDDSASDSVVLDARSFRDLALLTAAVPPESAGETERPIVVLRGTRRSTITARISCHDGRWRVALGAVVNEVRAPDEPEDVDPRLQDLTTMVWVTDRDRLACWFNDAWLTFVRADLCDQLGWGWMANVVQDDLLGLMRAYEAAHEARCGFDHVVRVVPQDGVAWWIRMRAAPRFTGAEFNGFVGICEPLAPAVASAPPAATTTYEMGPAAIAVARGASLAPAVERLARLESVLDVARPALTVEAAVLRRVVSRWVQQHDRLTPRHDEIVLAVGEATANAVIHAYSASRERPGTVRLMCELRDDEAEFRVRDWGAWMEPRAGRDSRGTTLMRKLSDGFEVVHRPDGTDTVLRYHLA
jgi:anti-sigma regulatory factor (Ser/Thr protein kinase)